MLRESASYVGVVSLQSLQVVSCQLRRDIFILGNEISPTSLKPAQLLLFELDLMTNVYSYVKFPSLCDIDI